MRRFSEMRWEIRQTTKEKIMGIFSMILSLLSGVALFLFGMSLMGDGLKMVAGNKLEAFLYRMTNTPLKGVALGTGVTSVIQSSSATTVMVIGFVNSGMMKLKQAIGIIMGANIGTSITGWILCLSYIDGKNGIAKILSTATISAVVAIIGIILRMACKRSVHKNIGNIMLGFAILMTGMQTMSGAVSPLKDSPTFTNMLTNVFQPADRYSGRYCIYRSAAECICHSRCIAGVICNRYPDILQCIPDRSWYRCRCCLSGSDFSNRCE